MDGYWYIRFRYLMIKVHIFLTMYNYRPILIFIEFDIRIGICISISKGI